MIGENQIDQRKSISYEEALQEINQEVQDWNKNLTVGGNVILKGIGELTLNSENKINFSPYEKVNFDSNSIGLASFTKKPVAKTFETKTTVPAYLQRRCSASESNTRKELSRIPEQANDSDAKNKITVSRMCFILKILHDRGNCVNR